MGHRLVNTERATGIASRRAAQDRFARVAPWAVAAGLGVGALAMATGRAFGLSWAGWPIAIGGAALGLISSAGIAARATWPARRAARELDRRADLKDTLGSAMELADSQAADPFVRTILDHAEASAARVEVARLVPVRARAGEWGWSALALGACFAATWMPPIARPEPASKPAIVKAEAVASVQQARRAIESIRSGAGDAARELAALESLERELAEGKTGSVDAVAKAAEQVERAADRAEAKAAELQSDVDRVRRLLSASPDEKPASELGRALGAADTEAAAKAAAALRENLKRMDPAERERVAQELAEIAERLDDASSNQAGPGPGGASPDAGPESASRDAGSPEASDVPARVDDQQAGAPPGAQPGDGRTPLDEIRRALREASEQLKGAGESPSAPPTPPAEDAGADKREEGAGEKPPADKQPPGATGQSAQRNASDSKAPTENREQGSPGGQQGADSAGEPRQDRTSGAPQNQPAAPNAKSGTQPSSQPQAKPDQRPVQKSDQKPETKPSPGTESPRGQSETTPPSPPPGASDQNANGQTSPRTDPAGGKQPATSDPTADRTPSPDRSNTGSPNTGSPNPSSKDPRPESPTGNKPSENRPNENKSEGKTPQAGKADQAKPEQKLSPDQRAPKSDQPDSARPQGSPQPEKQTKPDGESSPRDGAARGAEPSPAGEPQPGGEPAPGGSKSDASRPKSAPSGSQQPAPAGKSDSNGSDRPSPGGPRDPAGQQRPPATPGTDAGEEPPPAPTQPPTPGDAIKGLEEALKRTEELQKLADRERSDAKDLRKQAEEILKNASPEERQRLTELAQRLASKMQGQGPKQPNAPGAAADSSLAGSDAQGPGIPPRQGPAAPDSPTDRTEAVDARRQTPTGERVIAKWFDPNSPNGAGVSREAIREDVRQAAAGAEKAIEQQVVPGRHSDLIRRVFRRYAERIEPAARPAPVEAAPDAPAKGGS